MAELSDLEKAQLSYSEVLDATKHQDDKIGRLLSAIAFLTAGALVFVNQGVLKARYAVGSELLPLPGIALGIFLGLVALAVLMLVLALTSPLTFPKGPTTVKQTSTPRSHLYFHAIAKESIDSWDDYWKPGSSTAEQLTAEYRSETHNLAVRADRKYSRTSEAGLVFIMAMLFFGLAVVLSIDVLINQPAATVTVRTEHSVVGNTSVTITNGSVESTTVDRQRTAVPPIRWTSLRRTLFGFALALFAGVILYTHYTAASSHGRRRFLVRLAPALLAFIFAATYANRRSSGWSWLPVEALLWTSGLAAVAITGHYFRPAAGPVSGYGSPAPSALKKSRKLNIPVAVIGVIVVGCAWAASGNAAWQLLGAALFTAALLFANRLRWR